MAYLLPSTFLSLLLFFPLSSAFGNHRPRDENLIHEVCKASRDPSTCKASLSKFNHLPPNASLTRVIDTALWVSSENLNKSRFMVHDILNASSGNQNRTKAAKSCKQVLQYAYYRTNLAHNALPQGKIKDARAWMSAALVYQYDCWSGLKKVNDTPLVVETMAFLNTSLMASTSNALGMLVNFDIFGENTKSWRPPKTERDGVWEIGSDRDKKVGGFPSGLKANITVCKSEDACDYKTVQEAVNAAPTKNIRGLGKWFVIFIKAGVYAETVRVPMKKKNVVFLGDGMGKTIITGSRNVGLQGLSTFKTATLGVLSSDRSINVEKLVVSTPVATITPQSVLVHTQVYASVCVDKHILGPSDGGYLHGSHEFSIIA
ncbi:hypothetical protein RD792_006628 [Penstemon davidsonii]|uniref:Pectinesterase inhibitor domain-containing protein n=1 Tax=Penstemon davidsonii TaxID=160366 RepID=A0ABR0DCY1_9LAMI|nr:hypothetical protein RD792_006628 [Penstemon davidsonii]